MMEVPHSYSEWVDVLEVFKNKEDDKEVLRVMKAGTVEWQLGVADKFLKRLVEAVNYRMNMANDRFHKELSRCRGEERLVIQALIAYRKELAFLASAVDFPAIPEGPRSQAVNIVLDQANAIQNSLEKSAKTDRSGKLCSIIRNNKVNSF